MCEWRKWELSRYQLRQAAGIYWLIDMRQPGYPYEKPLPLNELGARIWGMMGEGLGLEEMAEVLAGEYEASPEEIKGDVRAFCKQLEQHGIGRSL